MKSLNIVTSRFIDFIVALSDVLTLNEIKDNKKNQYLQIIRNFKTYQVLLHLIVF